jgi:hypothetical protein
MKKLSLIVIIASSLLSFNAHAEGRHGVQVESGSAVGYVYYGEDYKYALGFNVSHSSNDKEASTNKSSASAFARVGSKIMDKTYLYGGLSLKGTQGKIDGSKIDYKYSVSPYMNLDYHINNNFILNAGFTIVTYDQEQFEDSPKTNSYDYLGSYFGLTYLF